jgi:hypothetical protein
MYGNVAGSIEFIRNNIRIRSPYYYKLVSYDKNRDNLQSIINEFYDQNLKLAPTDKIKNRIRFISDKLVEVELSMNKIAIMNREHLSKIFGYDLSVKEKKTRNGPIFYPMYCEQKIHKPLYRLFIDAEVINYKDGNPLNLTEENLINNEDKIKIISDPNTYVVEFNPNKWLGGKYAGTIFCRSNDSAWNMVLKTDEKNYSKYYKFTNTNKQEKYNELNEIKMKLSDDLGLTKNKYRYIDSDTIEVKLDKEHTFITDSKFIDIVEKNALFITKSGNENSKAYVGMMIEKKNKSFHNFITGFNFVDHIDRNPLNNKLSNLRNSNQSENNKNRTVGPKIYDPDYLCGIRIINLHGYEYYEARIKINNIQKSKLYSIKNLGDNNALKEAIKWRLIKLKEFNSNNWHENDIITLYDLPKLDSLFYKIDNLDKMVKSNKLNIIFEL